MNWIILLDIVEFENGEIDCFWQPVLKEEYIFQVRRLYPQNTKILKTFVKKDIIDLYAECDKLHEEAYKWIMENGLLDKARKTKTLLEVTEKLKEFFGIEE